MGINSADIDLVASRLSPATLDEINTLLEFLPENDLAETVLRGDMTVR